MKTRHGFPVVSANNIFQVLNKYGLKPWPRVGPPMSVEDYLSSNRSDKEIAEVERFAPKTEYLPLKQPDGKTFNGFRGVGEDGVITFVLLEDDLVVIVADFVHGGEVIRLKPPAGLTASRWAPFGR